MKEDKLLEKLAELEHEQWIYWSKAIAQDLEELLPYLPPKTRLRINKRLERWNSYWINYDKLSEGTKEEDRKWARKVAEVINKAWYVSRKDVCEEIIKVETRRSNRSSGKQQRNSEGRWILRSSDAIPWD